MGSIWTLPNTLIGWLAVVALCGETERTRPVGLRGKYYVIKSGCSMYKIMDYAMIGGITLGEVVIIRIESLSKRVIAHEAGHVAQYRLWGLLFLPAYLVASVISRIRKGNWYRDNHFEVQAREGE